MSGKEEVGVHADAPTGPVVEGVPPPSPGGVLKPSEVLDRAAALIEPEGRWTQHEYARGAGGRGVNQLRYARCVCIVGAILTAGGVRRVSDLYPPEVKAAWDKADKATGGNAAVWNDRPERTQAEAVEALRKAAELARSEGQ